MLIEQNIYLSRKIKNSISPLSNSYTSIIDKLEISKSIIIENCRLSNFEEEITLTEKISNLINSNFKQAIIIGVGGAISASLPYVSCNSYHHNQFKLIYCDSLDLDKQNNIFTKENLRNSAVIVISRSGESVETITQLCEIIRRYKLYFNFQHCLEKHFYIITQGKNTLSKIGETIGARIYNYSSKSGKFSAFSTVGLLPAKLLDLNINEIIKGALNALEESDKAIESAWINFQLMQLGYNINVLSFYEDKVEKILSWYSQISNEITAKNKKGSTYLTTGMQDQHGAWQLFLDGPNDKYFTFLWNKNYQENSNETLNLIRKTYYELNKQKLVKMKAPIREIVIPDLNARTIGFLMMQLLIESVLIANLLNVHSTSHPAINRNKNDLSKICTPLVKKILKQIL